MNLKQSDFSVRVRLIYTLIIILPLANRCSSSFSITNSHSTPQDVKKDLLTSRGLRELLNFNSEGRRNSRNSENVQNKEVKEAESSERRPEETLRSNMAAVSNNKRVKNRIRTEINEEKPRRTSSTGTGEDCRAGKIQQVIPGKFTITGYLETNVPAGAYQADSAGSAEGRDGHQGVKGQWLRGSEENWQRLQPEVECGNDAMTLTVKRRRAAQLMLHHVNQSSVPLTRLPPRCGYSLQTSLKDLSLTAQYDACHVIPEDGSFVLPLIWRSIPVQMSCPSSRMESPPAGPPSLCCSPSGLTVSVPGRPAEEELSVKVRGEWTSLPVLAKQCGYSVERRETELVIAAPFVTCGITEKDGKYKLSLQIGDKTFTLACPVHPEQLNSHLQPSEPLLWAPPFYLAPPYYPHPTYHHQDPYQDARNPPMASDSTPEPTFYLQPRSPVDSQALQTRFEEYFAHFGDQSSLRSSDDLQDSSKLDPGLQQKHDALTGQETSTHSPSSETSPLQTPSHAFSQYYHYYHLPKIPLIDPTQPSEAPEASAHPPPLPSSPEFVHKPVEYHPPLLNPNIYFYYFPHISRGEAKRAPPLTDHQNPKFLHPRSSEYKLNPSAEKQTQEEVSAFPNISPEERQHQILAQETEDTPYTQPHGPIPVPHPPSSLHNLPPHLYYLHPYYQYIYQLISGAQSLLKHPNHTSPTSSKQTLNPLAQSSSSQTQHQSIQTTSPPTKPKDDARNPAPHPLYYYYPLYYPPKASADNHEEHHAGPISSKEPPSKHSDHGWMALQPPAAADNAGFPSMQQQLHSFYSHYFSQQHPHDPSGHPDDEEEEEEEENDGEITDKLEVESSQPSTSPCSLGFVSDHCSSALGCCLVSANDCSEELPMVLVVPESMPDLPSEVFDQTGVHLFELHGVQSPEEAHSSAPEETAVRFMEDCDFSPGCPGEVGLKDPPPSVAPMVLQLRLATDESFSTFHPDSHLPLSLVWGRPVYLEVRLLNPLEPDLVLLLHSCIAHTAAPNVGWMMVYDSCSSLGNSWLLPSHPSDLQHIQRLVISSFLSLPPENHLDTQIHFVCLTEVCSGADAGCAVSCFNSPNSNM